MDKEDHAHYRTKESILELYDTRAACQRTDKPFVSSMITDDS